MSTLRIGVIGTGAIGQDHIKRITDKLVGGKVTAVTDINAENAAAAAAICGARVEKDSAAVVGSPDVDAVVVASYGPAHAESVLQCIAEGKPVFCEKPLASNADDCKKIVGAEAAKGKKFVQVGFMRRYDKGYRQMKELIESGMAGAPLMVHCAHRNASVAPDYTTNMAVNDTAIHEIDIIHWLIDDQYKTARVILPKSTRHARPGLTDPQLMILTTESGVVIDIEVFVNCRYGYDIQCEVCCEDAVIRMPEPSFPLVRRDAVRGVKLETDWKQRFIEAYDIELQDWITSTLKGEVNGPTAWDGYLAAVTADALVKSQSTGAAEPVVVGNAPDIYR